MKEALASTLAGFHGLGSTDDHRERPVDRLGALAMAQAKAKSAAQSERGDALAQESYLTNLGAMLVGLKHSHRSDFRAEVDMKLSITLRWECWNMRLSGKQADRIARWAVTEYILPFCLTCRGAKEAPNFKDVDGAQPMVSCPSCSGTGLRRYTDSDRLDAMGEKYDKAMDVAHQSLARAESLAIRGYAQMLERWPA